MRHLFVALCLLAFASCSGKQGAIDDLEAFVGDIVENQKYYTAEEWADAEAIYQGICDDLDQYEYTSDEKTKIANLKGQYMVLLAKHKVEDGTGFVKDIIDMVGGAAESIGISTDDLVEGAKDMMKKAEE